MNLPPDAVRRTETDQVAWLTTVADSGAPVPNPVWFVPEGGALVVFSQRQTRKVHNLEARPKVALHFNSDAAGGDVVVITGDAELAHDQKPSGVAPYLAKYESTITGVLGMTVDQSIVLPAYSIPEVPNRIGRVVLVDGTWKATRATACSDLALGGVTCPR